MPSEEEYGSEAEAEGLYSWSRISELGLLSFSIAAISTLFIDDGVSSSLSRCLLESDSDSKLTLSDKFAELDNAPIYSMIFSDE